MIQSVSNGIYDQGVDNVQVKIGEGDFAFYVAQGRMIENCQLTASIKEVNVMGNGPKLLQHVIMVANDLQMYEGGAEVWGKGTGSPAGVRVACLSR